VRGATCAGCLRSGTAPVLPVLPTRSLTPRHRRTQVIAGLVQAGERVMVLAGPDEAVRRQARATIDSAIGEAFGGDGEAAIAAASAAVELLDMVTDDTWLRDTGPSCVVNDAGEVRWCARSLSLSSSIVGPQRDGAEVLWARRCEV